MGPLMHTFPTPAPIAVTVDIPVRSDIQVVASDRTDTVVTIEPRSASRGLDVRAADQAVVDLSEGRLTVRLQHWRLANWLTDGGAVDVTVEVPIGCSLDLRSGMGDLRCQGEFASAELMSGMGAIRIDHCGPLQAKTGTGDVAVERVTGSAQLSTGTGTLRVGEVEGDAVLRNGNGHTLVGEVSGDLKANAANGDIVVERSGDAVTAKAANGGIRVGEAGRGRLTLQAAYGAVEVGVPEGTAAWLELDTKYGRVRNQLIAAPDPGTARSTVEIRARNAYSDITIRRSTVETRTNR
jgi:DUF4097 and DUF4098 domain-containing protein YvlB